ncbi:hypothetical protein PROFUN_15393 [Planoprotostelium fungivorum]|uniref:Uncharacterized protein n=1 Tax=Planoprotostelium fungivorum TaxID=1890364 RepID=A0A2P6MVF7_9EUKA|nr:hypothetical protein PROFUN_15393 [Planoprotostelium fungivorum]
MEQPYFLLAREQQKISGVRAGWAVLRKFSLQRPQPQILGPIPLSVQRRRPFAGNNLPVGVGSSSSFLRFISSLFAEGNIPSHLQALDLIHFIPTLNILKIISYAQTKCLAFATYGLDQAQPNTLQDVAQITPSIAFETGLQFKLLPPRLPYQASQALACIATALNDTGVVLAGVVAKRQALLTTMGLICYCVKTVSAGPYSEEQYCLSTLSIRAKLLLLFSFL